MPLDRVIAFGGVMGHVQASTLRYKPSAVFVDQSDVSEQVKQLRLGLVDTIVGRDDDIGSAV